MQVAIEARLVDGVDRTETHRHGRELPVPRHEPRMRIRREPDLPAGLATEVVEAVFVETELEIRTRVDPGRRVSLIEDLIAAAGMILPAEEVIEADLIKGRSTRVRRKVSAETRGPEV